MGPGSPVHAVSRRARCGGRRWIRPPIAGGSAAAGSAAIRAHAVACDVGWDRDQWPADVSARLEAIAAGGADRLFVSVGSAGARERIADLATWARDRGSAA